MGGSGTPIQKEAKTRRSSRDARARLEGRAHPPTPAAPPHPNPTPPVPLAWPRRVTRHTTGSRRGPSPSVPPRRCELLQPSPSSNGPPPHPRVQALSGGGRGSPPAPPPLTLPASITVSPLATSPTRCAHPSTAASPRPPIQLRLIFFSSFDLIATHRSRREGGILGPSFGWMVEAVRRFESSGFLGPA